MQSSDHETVGFMDIGTNSIHILVVRFFENSMGTTVFQDKEVIRLGRDLYRYGHIGYDAIEKCRLTTDRFTEAAKNMGATKVIAYATCAAREAGNRAELIKALDSDGLDVRIIPGQEEARIIRLGVLGPDGPDERTLLIDIGGGSTEIVVAEGGTNLYMDSLDIGSVRYAYGFVSDPNAPMSESEYDFLRRRTWASSYRAVRTVRQKGFAKAVGSSGTLISLAEICAARRDGDASYMTASELRETMDEIRKMGLEERLKVPKMNPSRADIIVAGGAAAEELMSLFGIERIEISDKGLKEGMLMDYLLRKGQTDFDIKGSSVLSLANRCSYDVQHAEEVRSKSMMLFDMMKAEGIHKMDDKYRQLLEYAATLHDIGEFINYTKHHVHSYTIITNSCMLGFDDQDLEAIGLMAKFHHKKFPDLRDKQLRNMPKKTAENILRCAMILKIADIFDRHRTRSVKDVRITVKKGVATFVLYSDDDIRMEIWGLESIAGDFRKVFGLDLKIIFKKGDKHQ